MDSTNLALLRGVITATPWVRTLPSGGVVTQIELATRVDGRTVSVPVALHDRTADVTDGDEVVVTGYVSRRFFRVGGATQSRTEVVATEVIRVSRRKAVERAVDRVVARAAGFR